MIESGSGGKGASASPQDTPFTPASAGSAPRYGSEGFRWGAGTLGLAVVLISIMVLGSYHGNLAGSANATGVDQTAPVVPGPPPPDPQPIASASPGDPVIQSTSLPVPGGNVASPGAASSSAPAPASSQPAAKPTPTPTRQATGPSAVTPAPGGQANVPALGSNQVRVAAFTRAAPREQTGRTVRVRVEVEQEMPTDPDKAATQMAAVLQDPRSWSSKQRVRFAFVGEGAHDLVIRVLTPGTTDKRCLPLRTLGEVSCSTGNAVNLNGVRWETGIADYAGDLDGYR
ncbi:MAG: DUF3152 domain-containing protein, partial [Propionibacteriaceae bacterium]|nr:DUF3152 domain-containing protein [Propionibacteriaceae bacterium]